MSIYNVFMNTERKAHDLDIEKTFQKYFFLDHLCREKS